MGGPLAHHKLNIIFYISSKGPHYMTGVTTDSFLEFLRHENMLPPGQSETSRREPNYIPFTFHS